MVFCFGGAARAGVETCWLGEGDTYVHGVGRGYGYGYLVVVVVQQDRRYSHS